MTSEVLQGVTVRALARADLDAVVAIDAELEGHARRAYIEGRLAAAIRQPDRHVQLAAVDIAGGGLCGYILARRTVGEFGRPQPGLRLELVGVRADRRGQGLGRQLMEALTRYAQRHDLHELRTTAHWTDRRMLGWLQAMGFALAPDQIVSCAVGEGYQAERADLLDSQQDLAMDTSTRREIDYGAPEGNDFERAALASPDVRAMQPEDLAPIVRIDRQITGRDRHDYIAEKLGETLADSAIRVSLTARLDGAIVGLLMARADLGDFGRSEAVAVLDTIGVDPAYAHRGVGHALISQLFANLAELRVDRVETVVSTSDLALAGLLYSTGFAPSQRLAFRKPL